MVQQQDFDQALDDLFARGLQGTTLLAGLAGRFPNLSRQEFDTLARNAQARMEARLVTKQRELQAAEQVLPMFDGLPPDVSLGAAVDLKAAEGDPHAIALRRHINSPAFRMKEAMIKAAVAAHPDWSEMPDGSFRHRPPKGEPSCDPDEALEALIDWFGDEHTAEAAAIYKRIMGKPLPLHPE